MDVDLNEDQELFAETTRKFLEAECPITEVRRLHTEVEGFTKKYWKSAAELGWTTLLISESDGGGSISGNGVADLAIVAEEVGRLVSPGPVLPVNVVASAISRSGSDEVRAQVLPTLLSGDEIATWAFNEKGMRWDPSRVSTTAKREGDSFVLNGTKIEVEAAAQSKFFLVTAKHDGALAQFVVEAETPGLTVTQTESIDLVRRFGTVELKNVKVSASAQVGTSATAADDVEYQLLLAVAIQNVETCGLMDRAFEFTVEYLGDRYLFGRALASYQALKHRVADWKLRTEGSQAIACAAAKALGANSEDAPELVSAGKSYIAGMATEMLQDCVQLLGGIGVTWEHDVHLYLRRATLNRGLYGTPYEHRERVTKLLELAGAK